MKTDHRFFKVSVFVAPDPRGDIIDITFPENEMLPFDMRQNKIVPLSTELPRGEHFHKPETGRIEVFVVVSKTRDKSVVKARFRNLSSSGRISEIKMKTGDAVFIPPGISHSFLALEEGVSLFGYSNIPYNKAHDTIDKLF